MPRCWCSRAPAGRGFLVGELLGRGATATVFRGTDLADGRPVAIKVAEGPEPRQAERIHAEARILASLDHPAIVTFIAEGVVPAGDRWAGRPFIVEELVYGGSLAERIRSGPADARDVAGWAAAALSGLAHVHARGPGPPGHQTCQYPAQWAAAFRGPDRRFRHFHPCRRQAGAG